MDALASMNNKTKGCQIHEKGFVQYTLRCELGCDLPDLPDLPDLMDHDKHVIHYSIATMILDQRPATSLVVVCSRSMQCTGRILPASESDINRA